MNMIIRTDDRERRSSLQNSHDGNDEIHATMRIHHNHVLSLNAVLNEMVSENVGRLSNISIRENPLLLDLVESRERQIL